MSTTPEATNEAPFIVLLDIDDTITIDRPFSPNFDAFLPSNREYDLPAYFRPGIFEFIRRLARQNVKFGFVSNRSGPFGHSIVDLLRYGLALGCPTCSTRIGPVHEYYSTMMGRVKEPNPEQESAFKVPMVTVCGDCSCGVSALPALEDQLERRIRHYHKAAVSKLLTDIFADRQDWERAILIEDRREYVVPNLGHGIHAYHSQEDFETGLLERILPMVEKCVEATREQRQRLGARLEESKAAAMQREQEELAKLASIVGEDIVKQSQDAVKTLLDAETNAGRFSGVPDNYNLVRVTCRPKKIFQVEKSKKRPAPVDPHKNLATLPHRWSNFFQARVAPRPALAGSPTMPPPRLNTSDCSASEGAATTTESVHDLWTQDPVCRTLLSMQYGEDGYQELLAKVSLSQEGPKLCEEETSCCYCNAVDFHDSDWQPIAGKASPGVAAHALYKCNLSPQKETKKRPIGYSDDHKRFYKELVGERAFWITIRSFEWLT
jgi:hypothetical protein